jgi:nucleoside-diphosphate-sugar epimerase
MAGRIFVTGASGFVGRAVIEELLSRGYRVNALVNRRPLDYPAEKVRSIPGGLFDPKALNEGVRDTLATIHLVGIIAESRANGVTFERIHFHGTKSVVDAAVAAGVKRFIHMSALGARPNAESRYHQTKYLAEQYVQSSGLDWTIFRPSLIHGAGGEFINMEAKWARHRAPPFFFMPYFGAGPFGCGGAGLLQPVFVKDVARAMVDALEKPKTVGEIYLLGGQDRMTWPEMHKTVSKAIVGKARRTVAIPVWKAKLLSAIGIGQLLGFNRDQVVMSQENSVCDLTKFKDDFGWEPRGFGESLESYAKGM